MLLGSKSSIGKALAWTEAQLCQGEEAAGKVARAELEMAAKGAAQRAVAVRGC